MNAPPHILVVFDSAEARQRWASALQAAGLRVSSDWRSTTDDDAFDVLVSDRAFEQESTEPQRAAIARGEIGVVAVAAEFPADVSLPADCTDRELVQVCRLLGEIVGLRRQQRRGDRDRQTLSQLALTDPLTGLANRRAWDEEWRARVVAARDSQRSICLAIIDLDHFKQVNELRGFAAGDEVLRAASRAILASVRNMDFVARLGGDEFALLLEDVNASHALAVVERTRLAVRAELTSYSITASAGLAVSAPAQPSPADELFHAADEKLRHAKSSGRDRTIAS